MQNLDDARRLAHKMNKIGNLAKKETVSVITNMDEPLGCAIGNSLEIIEVVKALSGDIQEDVKEVVLELGSYILKLAGKGDNIEENKNRILDVINSKKGFDKFKELVENQGGDVTYLEDFGRFEKAKYVVEVISKDKGYIEEIDAKEVGNIAHRLGAGRDKKEDKIDFSAGVELYKKVSDRVDANEILAKIYTNKENYQEEAQKLLEIIKITDKPVNRPKTILEVI